jgi:hypothetical protein
VTLICSVHVAAQMRVEYRKQLYRGVRVQLERSVLNPDDRGVHDPMYALGLLAPMVAVAVMTCTADAPSGSRAHQLPSTPSKNIY